MRVLFVTNVGPRCGVSQFGSQNAAALLAAGQDVTVHLADYPTYLPENSEKFDVVHINFHPGTLGHIQPQHLPKKPLISIFWHETSPRWGREETAPPLFYAPNALHFAAEPIMGMKFFPIPVADYMPEPNLWDIGGVDTINRFQVLPEELPEPPVLIGHTGLRRDGLDWLAHVCERRGWAISPSEGWRSLEEEIERLARCHLVVCHSHAGYAGMASAPMTAVAARRPILINSGRMLSVLSRINEVDFGGSQLYKDDNLERGIETILEDIASGREKRPLEIAKFFCWSRRVHAMIEEWEGRLA